MSQPGASTETKLTPHISTCISGLSVYNLIFAVFLNRSGASDLPRAATYLPHGFLYSLASAMGGFLHFRVAATRIVPAIAAEGADCLRNLRVPVPICCVGTLALCCTGMVTRGCYL
ncbi:hypothetical protein Mapa_000484 [Marchantia paleacea]|nr:hypothetical protein Mapa_000484 [Marchantia paleacea]